MDSIESTTKSGREQVGPPPPAAGSIRHPARPSLQQKTSDKKTFDKKTLVTVKELADELGKSSSATYRLLFRIRQTIGPLEPVSNRGEFYRPAVDQRLMELSFSQEGMPAK